MIKVMKCIKLYIKFKKSIAKIKKIVYTLIVVKTSFGPIAQLVRAHA